MSDRSAPSTSVFQLMRSAKRWYMSKRSRAKRLASAPPEWTIGVTVASPDRYRRSVCAPGDVAALAQRARVGDADAWDHLYRLAYPRLIAYARRRLPGDAAVDAVSETMARAVAKVD